MSRSCIEYANNKKNYELKRTLRYNDTNISLTAVGNPRGDLNYIEKGAANISFGLMNYRNAMGFFIRKGIKPQNDSIAFDYLQTVREQLVWLNDMCLDSGIYSDSTELGEYGGIYSFRQSFDETVILHLALYRELFVPSNIFLSNLDWDAVCARYN